MAGCNEGFDVDMSSPINDGGPAFPFGQISELTGQPINGFFNAGISMRDYFAAAALHGLLGSYRQWAFHEYPVEAYKLADEMLLAREVKP